MGKQSKQGTIALALTALALASALSGCATYRVAKNVKLIGYDEDAARGKSIGEVRGESCSWKVFGTPVTTRESLDEAFADARTRHSNLRYIKGVTTDNGGFDAAGIVTKRCLIVKAVAYL